MEDRKIEKVLYMKFNNNDKRGALMQASKKGIVIIDKPFKEVLKETIEKEEIVETKEYNKSFDYEFNYKPEVQLLWTDLIHANHLKERGEQKWTIIKFLNSLKNNTK